MRTPATASQTVGPYYRIGLAYRFSSALCTEAAPGEHITVTGMLYDGEGIPIPDAQLELWQADDQGRIAGLDSGPGLVSEGFAGFARVPFDEEGRYRFATVKPGAVTGPDGTLQAPHIVVMLFMRGILKHLHTRIYFAGESLNDTDLTLNAVPSDRRATLIAQPSNRIACEYTWNIHMQGRHETVFFAY